MDIVKTVADLEQSSELHMARLLLLLNAFAVDGHEGAIDGMTKLAKLDFLLRYPVMLERALLAKGYSTRELQMEDHERLSVESVMVRYRFGPWDHRYREYLNLLVAKGLASVRIDGHKVVISASDLGRERARQLAESDLFESYAQRAGLLRRHFNLTGTNLMRFIYKTFPEIVSMRSNSAIQI